MTELSNMTLGELFALVKRLTELEAQMKELAPTKRTKKAKAAAETAANTPAAESAPADAKAALAPAPAEEVKPAEPKIDMVALEAEIREVIQYVAGHNRGAAVEILTRFGAKRFADVSREHWPELLKAFKEVK